MRMRIYCIYEDIRTIIVGSHRFSEYNDLLKRKALWSKYMSKQIFPQSSQ